MLKRKRVSKRSTNNSRKGRQQSTSEDLLASTSSLSSSPPTHGFDGLDGGAASSTPSRRSKLADRTSSLLSQLHPGRWVRSSSSNDTSHHHRKDALASATASISTPSSSLAASKAAAILTSPATMVHSREKAKRWVREQATRFLESYFKVNYSLKVAL
jgi:hypothetical protein